MPEDSKAAASDPRTIAIPTESPGLIPLGAELYREDRTHLAQVGTEVLHGRRVHPLTVYLTDSAVAFLDRFPSTDRFVLLGYGADGILRIRRSTE